MAELAYRPVVDGLRGKVRIAVGKHVLEDDRAIIGSKYRQPGGIVILGGRTFTVVGHGVIGQVGVHARARLQPLIGGPIAGHGGCFKRVAVEILSRVARRGGSLGGTLRDHAAQERRVCRNNSGVRGTDSSDPSSDRPLASRDRSSRAR